MLRRGILIAVIAPFIALPILAADLPIIQVSAGATQVETKAGVADELLVETFRFDKHFVGVISSAPIGQRVRIYDFPVEPGQRATVEIERYDVHSRDAETWINDGSTRTMIPNSDRVHFLGRSVAYPTIGVGVSVNPDGTKMVGTTLSENGFFSLASLEDGVAEIGVSWEKRTGIETNVTCDTPSMPEFGQAGESSSIPLDFSTFLKEAEQRVAAHQVTVAFDTDAELLAKYPNANNDIADWVTATNVLFERGRADNPPGPAFRMLKGHTEIRTGADPYTSTSTLGQLTEVENEWVANFGGTSRTFVALFSGKGGNCSGAGIAWVDSYCSNTRSYSATQVLSNCGAAGNLNSETNVMLMGHEIIHNAGSTHTHCYNPRIDTCYGGECGSGCHCGGTTCPDFSGLINGIAANRGTLMSYCHLGGVANCDSSPFFHPTVASRVGASIDANVCQPRQTSATCVEPIGGCGGTTNTLTVAKNGTGTGTVTSGGLEINCGATCSSAFTTGTQVTLSAAPGGGSAFAGWAGGGCSGTGTCSVTMNADTQVTATFNTSGGGCTSTPLTCGVPVAGTTAGAASALSGYSCSGDPQANQEIVYAVTPASSGTVTVDLMNLVSSDLDLFAMSSCNPASCLAGSENAQQSAEQVSFAATAGTTYYISVEDWQGSGSTFSIQATCPTAAGQFFADGFERGNASQWSNVVN